MYSTMDGIDRQSDPNSGASEQSHAESDATSFDQGVEKLDTETDERFLSWLYVSLWVLRNTAPCEWNCCEGENMLNTENSQNLLPP